MAVGQPPPPALADVITLKQPLGPSATEGLIETGDDAVFYELYDETNHIHRETHLENPTYIVGRKGAGKTAFLLGGALADHAHVVLIKSEDVYTEVNRLRVRYAREHGALVADTLVHAWEVLLFHAAMLGVARSKHLPNSAARQRVWAYISAFGDPATVEADHLLAAVSAQMTQALLEAPPGLSFREACWSVETERGSFREAADQAREVLAAAGRSSVYVVVDNLEDLHRRLDDFADVVTALLRITSRAHVARRDRRLPFMSRFAFPAELLPRLQKLAANPEKDFLDYLTIRWTASELIVVVGNRLRTFLDLYFPGAPKGLRLPRQHDPADRDAAEATLRALLPDLVTNGYGSDEDPVAYLLRHTQLLPRQLIQMLNEIMGRAVVGLARDDLPRATADHVIAGVGHAELRIVEGILSAHSHNHPRIREALDAIKNHAKVVERVSDLHRAFNHAKVSRVGLDFEKFLRACLSVGALGIVSSEQPDARYIEARFSYTFTSDIRAVEDRDRVCVHPLFMYRWFDRPAIAQLGRDTKPVYPYGSDPSQEDLDV